MFQCISGICGTGRKYLPKEEAPAPCVDFTHLSEPHLADLVAYLNQRRVHVKHFASLPDVRTELTRKVTDQFQLIDQYPKGRQNLNNDEYVSILKDMLNLSALLDDMEQTGLIPYLNRTPFYNMYAKLFRLLNQV